VVEEGLRDLKLRLHQRDRFFLRDRRRAATARCVLRDRCLQVGCDTKIVHNQPAWLVAEHPVHPRDGLHQPVPLHRLVDVHRVQRRHVEAGQPHVAHDDQLQRVVRVFEAFGDGFAARLVADVR
jgi:hypothetical protein